jgi:hypothetical protein
MLVKVNDEKIMDVFLSEQDSSKPILRLAANTNIQGQIQSRGTVGQAISRGHLLGMKLNYK